MKKRHIKRSVSMLLVMAVLLSAFIAFPLTAKAATTAEEAKTIKMGSTYTKWWNADNDHLIHYDAFSLSQSGIVTLKASKPRASSGDCGSIEFTFYDKDLNPIVQNRTYEAAEDGGDYYVVKVGLPAGKYYLSILPMFSVIMGSFETNYSLSFQSIPCELESNNTMEEAMDLAFDVQYTAHFGTDIGEYGLADFYKFDVIAGHTYRLTFGNAAVLKDTSSLLEWMFPGSVAQYIGSDVASSVDTNGKGYCEATAAVSGTAYVNLYNYILQQYEYTITVTDVTAGPVNRNVVRLAGNTRYDTAIKSAEQMKKQLGVKKFECIVVAYGENFPDALSGTYLAAVKNAPMLLVRNNKSTINQVKNYIKENLAAGGTLYLLGDRGVVPESMEQGYTGVKVKRLGGVNRYETNLLILKEAGVGDKDILICTGKGFADSLSASAVGMPILLVKDSLTSSQQAFLKNTTGKKYIIGGTTAVSSKIEEALKKYGAVERVGGSTRYQTSVAVAERFFSAPETIVLAYAGNFPDGLCGGPLAYRMNAPLILTANGKQSAAATYAEANGITCGYVLGGSTLIADGTVKKIFGTYTVISAQ